MSRAGITRLLERLPPMQRDQTVGDAMARMGISTEASVIDDRSPAGQL